MYREKAIGRNKEEALEAAMDALKERLWRECWKEEIDLPGVKVVEREVESGIEITVEI